MSEKHELSEMSDEELLAAYAEVEPTSEDGNFLFAEMVTRGLDK